MGAGGAWQRRRSLLGPLVLASATGVTAAWAFVLLSRTTAYGSALRFGVLAVGIATTLLLLVVARLHRRAVLLVAAAAVVAGLAGPAAYSATTLSTAHSGSIVSAGPATGGPGGGFGGPPRGGFGSPPGGGFGAPPGASTTGAGGMRGLLDAEAPDAAVVAALEADAARYTWVAAAVGSQNAAGLQLATRLPVMAIGGFNGSDPSPTLAQFQEYVAQGRIHYLVAGGGFRGQQGGSNAASEINAWVAEHYTAVTLGGQTFYDLTQPTKAAS